MVALIGATGVRAGGPSLLVGAYFVALREGSTATMTKPIAPPSPLLTVALRHLMKTRWQGMRSERTSEVQSMKAISTVESLGGHALTVAEVSHPKLLVAVQMWRAQGLAPATINKRLSCLSAMGVNVNDCYANNPRTLKWWLKPADQTRLTEWLRADPANARNLRMADYIDWTVWTGLRVEETLRLKRSDFELDPLASSVTVPGLKTGMAQMTLPIGADASAIAWRRLSRAKSPDVRLFSTSYNNHLAHWQECREFIGAKDHPGSTLKALRRCAARYLTVTKGMPLDVLRQYLRHENVETTIGYLRLTGGYNESEMRKWL